jgi:hypothetical protein
MLTSLRLHLLNKRSRFRKFFWFCRSRDLIEETSSDINIISLLDIVECSFHENMGYRLSIYRICKSYSTKKNMQQLLQEQWKL